MLALKESFLKFLRDDDETPNIKFKKPNSNINPKNLEEKNEIILPKNNNNINKYSFQNFVSEIKNFDYNKKIKWESQIHKSSLLLDTNGIK